MSEDTLVVVLNNKIEAFKRARDELVIQRDESHERTREAERDAAVARMTINDARKHFLRSTTRAEKRTEALKRERDGIADAIRHEVIQAAYVPSPMCRDCADHDGRCPHSGELCDPYEAVLEYLRKRAAMQSVVNAARAWRKEDEMDDTKAVRVLLMTLNALDKETGRAAEERR